MKKFDIVAKLLYEYLDGSGFRSEINYKYSVYSFIEPWHSSTVEVHPDFAIQIKELVCESHDQAILTASSILEHICRAISISMQLQNYDIKEWQPNVSFKKSDIKIICEEPLETQVKDIQCENGSRQIYVKDEAMFRDGIHLMRVTHSLDLTYIDVILRAYQQDSEQQFYVDAIFRALRSRDIESKYFTLFTIIEKLEVTFSKDENISQLLFSNEQQQKLLNIVHPQLAEILEGDNVFVQRINNRISQIVKSATVKTRAEKLCYILNQQYKITRISKGLLQFDVDINKVKEFIERRNGLFHGKQVDETAHNKMVKLTNELLEVCLKILSNECI